MRDHGYEEDSSAHRVTRVNQFGQTSFVQDVVDDGRNVVFPDLVPPDFVKKPLDSITQFNCFRRYRSSDHMEPHRTDPKSQYLASLGFKLT